LRVRNRRIGRFRGCARKFLLQTTDQSVHQELNAEDWSIFRVEGRARCQQSGLIHTSGTPRATIPRARSSARGQHWSPSAKDRQGLGRSGICRELHHQTRVCWLLERLADRSAL